MSILYRHWSDAAEIELTVARIKDKCPDPEAQKRAFERAADRAIGSTTSLKQALRMEECLIDQGVDP